MYNKVIILLMIFSFTFVSISNTTKKNRRKEKLELQLINNYDTCYYDNDTIKVSLSILNNSICPFFVLKSMTVSSYLKNQEMIFISIQHKNNKYLQIDRIYKNVSSSKFMILKNRPYKREYFFRVKKIIEKEKADSLFKLVRLKYHKTVDNKDWGKYKIQAMYINPKIDTIYSNVINITYLESKQ